MTAYSTIFDTPADMSVSRYESVCSKTMQRLYRADEWIFGLPMILDVYDDLRNRGLRAVLGPKRSHNSPTLYWVDAQDRLRHLEVMMYSLDGGELRIHADHHGIANPDLQLRKMGRRDLARLGCKRGDHKHEITCAPDELQYMAPWIVELVLCPDAGITTPPPVQFDQDNGRGRYGHYEWTAKAAKRSHEISRIRQARQADRLAARQKYGLR